MQAEYTVQEGEGVVLCHSPLLLNECLPDIYQCFKSEFSEQYYTTHHQTQTLCWEAKATHHKTQKCTHIYAWS